MPTQEQIRLTEQRKEEAKKVFEQYPEKFSEEVRQHILAQQVTLGMTPYDSYLAAGAFQYAVKADPKWPPNFDPRKIMWHQSIEPDDSKIAMTFGTETQFPGEGMVLFRVEFEKGKAIRISKV